MPFPLSLIIAETICKETLVTSNFLILSLFFLFPILSNFFLFSVVTLLGAIPWIAHGAQITPVLEPQKDLSEACKARVNEQSIIFWILKVY